MKIIKIILNICLSSVVISCTSSPVIPRDEALFIAGEITANQRLNRLKSESGLNEPDLRVTDLLPVEGKDQLAIAICRYTNGQGYAILIRRNQLPFEQLAMFGGDQYEQVNSLTSKRTSNGTVITVNHKTIRGNNAGIEKLLIRKDGSLKWLKNR